MVDGFGDKAKVIIDEKIVLNKFEGDPEAGILLETVYLTNGVITQHDYFDDDGNIV